MVFPPFTFMIDPTMNLVSESYHKCKRRGHYPLLFKSTQVLLKLYRVNQANLIDQHNQSFHVKRDFLFFIFIFGYSMLKHSDNFKGLYIYIYFFF